MRAFRLAYDGRPFYGFQRQPDVRTVEGDLLAALAALGVTDDSASGGDHPPTPPGYAAAGRTDRGVSALAQTVAFAAPDWLTPRALNGELPADVRAWASADAPGDFHATRDADWREYAYYLYAPGLDVGRIRRPLSRLAGTHDFHNLTAVTDREVDTTRTIHRASARRDGAFVVLRVRADGFLREMVRRIVTLCVGLADDGAESGRGADPPEGGGRGADPGAKSPSGAGVPAVAADVRVGLDRVLSAERLTGPEGIAPAPADPLVLAGVGYPGLAFERDDRGLDSLRAVFGTRRREAATRARVLGAIGEGAGAGSIPESSEDPQ